MVRIVLLAALCALLMTTAAAPGEAAERAGGKEKRMKLTALDPALATLARFVGGTWVNVPADPTSDLRIEMRYEWAMNGRAIRSTGVIGKGRPDATPIEATVGWDPARKRVYYLDFHGADTAFHGTMKADGSAVETEFETVVGEPGKFRSRTEFQNDDTVLLTIFARRDGGWAESHRIRLRRERS